MSQSTSVESTGTRSDEQIRDTIRGLVVELAPDPAQADTDNPRLIEDLGYHSLALLELAFAVEDEFDIEPIDQESAQSILTLADVCTYVIGVLREQNGVAATDAA